VIRIHRRLRRVGSERVTTRHTGADPAQLEGRTRMGEARDLQAALLRDLQGRQVREPLRPLLDDFVTLLAQLGGLGGSRR
jgi:hypothetical protein